MRAIYNIGLLVGIILTLVYVLQGFYADSIVWLSNVLGPSIACSAVISASFALHHYGHDRKKFSLVWICFTAGMLLWFMGELGWTVHALLLNVEIPYPSIADVFWLGGYIPLFIALYSYVKIFASALPRRTIGLLLAGISILSIAATVALIIPIVGVEEDLVTLGMDFAYPLLDLALLSASLLGLAVFLKGKLGKSWLLINAGILVTVAGDMLFSYTNAQGTYYDGHVLDLLYVYGYLFFALAFYAHLKEL